MIAWRPQTAKPAPGKYQSSIWDKKTKKTMIVTFVFLAAGLLFSWEFGQINGKNSENKTGISAAQETKFWNQLKFLNPGYPVTLRQETLEMGKRICAKLEAGWDPTRVLSYISQDSAKEDQKKMPTPAAQVLFWIGLEETAAEHLCPQQAKKLDGWMKNLEPKPPTIQERA